MKGYGTTSMAAEPYTSLLPAGFIIGRTEQWYGYGAVCDNTAILRSQNLWFSYTD